MAHRIKASGTEPAKAKTLGKNSTEKQTASGWRPGDMDDRGLTPDFERGAERDYEGDNGRH